MSTQMIDTGVNTALLGAKTWAKRYAWIMAVYIGLIVLAVIGMMIFSSSAMAGMPGGGSTIAMIITLIVVLGLSLPPILYLFAFARNSEEALASGNPNAFAAALTSLKSFFKFYVVLILVVIAFYALMLLIVLATGGLQNLTM